MGNTDYQHDESFVLHVVQHAVIADTKAPQTP